MKKPDHLTQHEWDDYQRNIWKQLQYEAYYAPMWVKKAGSIGAATIMGLIFLGVCYLIIKIFLAIGGLFT